MAPLRPPFHLLIAGLMTLLMACVSTPPTGSGPPRVPEQASSMDWEQDMQRFEARDATAPPLPGGVLFIGSSSIRFWDTLATDFPFVPVINRGFGGSEVRDSTWYADRIVIPYKPRQIVLYAGDNDLSSGRTPMQVHDDVRAFVQRVHRKLPNVKVAYIANKPSPARAHLLETQREANALIEADAGNLRISFIDVFTPMLDATGQPRMDLFLEDRLHMNRKGYELWRDTIAPHLQ